MDNKYYWINNSKYKGIVNSELYSIIKKEIDINFNSEISFNNSLSEYLKKDLKSNLELDNSSNQSSNTSDKVLVWTDGGSRNTGNVSGGHVNSSDEASWAYKISIGDKDYVDSNVELGATNNKMELTAIAQALKKLLDINKTSNVIIYSDSMYAINTITKWMKGWKAKGWHSGKNGKREVKNLELVQYIDSVLPNFNNFKMEWVKGHTEYNDYKHSGNIQVDSLLNHSMDNNSGYSSNHRNYSKTYQSEDATTKQINYLKHLDPTFKANDGLTKKEASLLISHYIRENKN